MNASANHMLTVDDGGCGSVSVALPAAAGEGSRSGVGLAAAAGGGADVAVPVTLIVRAGSAAVRTCWLTVSHHVTWTSGNETSPGCVATRLVDSVRVPTMPARVCVSLSLAGSG